MVNYITEAYIQVHI